MSQQEIERLNRQLVQLYQQGRYEQAIGLAIRARDLAYRYLSEDHPDCVTSLNNLAALYHALGNYAEAEPLFKKALEIDRKVLGKGHPDNARGLNNLATLYESMGNHAAAEPLYQEALKIHHAALGQEHPDYTTTLSNLAGLYRAVGNYTAAEPLYRQALEIDRKTLGEDHPDYATTLSNLAGLYRAMGNNAAAEPLYRQALEIRRAALGEGHPVFAASLSNLAGLYRAMGNYAAAEPLYRQAQEVCHTSLGADHPDYATSLDNLALLYTSMGNYAAAEALFRQAQEVFRTALGADHLDSAINLDNLALLYTSMGNYAAAEPLFRRALEIRRTALGADHPDYATNLDNLAALYTSMSNYAAAEPLFRQAQEVYRTALGADHLDSAISLNNLAALYRKMGNYAAAEPLLRQALDVYRAALGEDHPNCAISLNNLATLLIATSRAAEGLCLMEQAAVIDDRMIGQVFSIGSEDQRTAYLIRTWVRLEGFLSLVWRHLGASTEAISAALNLVLRRKAIGAEALAAQRDAVLGGNYPHLGPQIRQWTILRQQIVQKTLDGPGPGGLPAHQQQLTQWTLQKERLEAELARQIPEMNLERKLRAADRRAVTLGLPEGVALIEFVRFEVFDFHAVLARGEPEWKPARYLAFVLLAGKPDDMRMIDLGEAVPIDRLIADFRDGIIEETGDRPDRDVVIKRRPYPAPAVKRSAGMALRAALFDPLVPALGDRKRLLLAPDGNLARLPFEVLPTDDGRLLVDQYDLSYLGCGRDVLRFGAASTGQPTAALVAADPDFDFGGQDAAPSAPAERPRGRRSRSLDSLKFPIERLPATRIEGERIAARLGVQPCLGPDVLEGRLKAECHSPRILHLATHGFFLEDQKHDPEQELRGLGAPGGGSGRLSGPLPENPLLRAGLVLAGVNTWHATGFAPPDAEDGLLTAEDVSGMDLLATELVVLSACETGLGEVRTGEGVFGLQRAFVLAGAKTLVMSLWRVPDLTTAILMDRFYENLLRRGLGRAEALHDAQLHVRTLTVGGIRETWLSPDMVNRLAAGNPEAKQDLQDLARQPDDHRPFVDPFYWGAFICQGQPGPLPFPARS